MATDNLVPCVASYQPSYWSIDRSPEMFQPRHQKGQLIDLGKVWVKS